eukprot:GDKK01071134.1.p1 GENE.GDKK01071134.1~~GDKK01071134.1.p1  ORF type:complete len:597 (-),score=102.11 GDKK01071134.1:14-1804(-)
MPESSILDDNSFQILLAWIKTKRINIDDGLSVFEGKDLKKVFEICNIHLKKNMSTSESELRSIEASISQEAVDTINTSADRLSEIERARAIVSNVLEKLNSIKISDFPKELKALFERHGQLRRQHRLVARLLQVYECSEQAKKLLKSSHIECASLLSSHLIPLTAAACGVHALKFKKQTLQNDEFPIYLPSPSAVATLALSRTQFLHSRALAVTKSDFFSKFNQTNFLKFGDPPVLPPLIDDLHLSRSNPNGLRDVLWKQIKEKRKEGKRGEQLVTLLEGKQLGALLMLERTGEIIQDLKQRRMAGGQRSVDKILTLFNRKEELPSHKRGFPSLLKLLDFELNQFDFLKTLSAPLRDLLSSLLLKEGTRIARIDKPRSCFRLAANLWLHATAELLSCSKIDFESGYNTNYIFDVEREEVEIDSVTEVIKFCRSISWEETHGLRLLDVASLFGDVTADVVWKWMEGSIRSVVENVLQILKDSVEVRSRGGSSRSANESLSQKGGLSGALSRVVLSTSVLSTEDETASKERRKKEEELLIILGILFGELFESGSEWMKGFPVIHYRLFDAFTSNKTIFQPAEGTTSSFNAQKKKKNFY